MKIFKFLKRKPVDDCFACNDKAVRICKEPGCGREFCAEHSKQFIDEDGICFAHNLGNRAECVNCKKEFFLSSLDGCFDCRNLFCPDCLKKDPSLLRRCSGLNSANAGCEHLLCGCAKEKQQCAECGRRYCNICARRFIDGRTCSICDEKKSRQPAYCKECAEKNPGLLTKCSDPGCERLICELDLDENKCKVCKKSFCNTCNEAHLYKCKNCDEGICKECLEKDSTLMSFCSFCNSAFCKDCCVPDEEHTCSSCGSICCGDCANTFMRMDSCKKCGKRFCERCFDDLERGLCMDCRPKAQPQ